VKSVFKAPVPVYNKLMVSALRVQFFLKISSKVPGRASNVDPLGFKIILLENKMFKSTFLAMT
jgi:hypothetical protein